MTTETAQQQIDRIARHIHYPDCWDVAAYETLADAVIGSGLINANEFNDHICQITPRKEAEKPRKCDEWCKNHGCVGHSEGQASAPQ